MGKTLVIVESPAKGKTIERYLGKGYEVEATVGHIRDLPTKTLGVNIEQDFKLRYVTVKNKQKLVTQLKEKAKASDHVLIATDPDREGEAIAWHLTDVLKLDPTSDCRIVFNEITEHAIQNSLKNPRGVNINLVNAQQARRTLDRLVGFELSPILWDKIRKNLSAGRVQSVATRMIVEREEAIEAFKPEEYWNLYAFFLKEKNTKVRFAFQGLFQAGSQRAKKVKLEKEADVKVITDALKDVSYVVQDVRKKRKQKTPAAPFTTSTLQQEAGRKLGFSSKRTMMAAQRLYDGIEVAGQGRISLISYIRTDSVRIAPEAIDAARTYIKTQYGDKFLPKSARFFKKKNAAQDAHEAIRPTHFDLPPFIVKDSLTGDVFKLYRLIWERFIACQMIAADIESTTVDCVANDYLFRVSGEVIVFSGFLSVFRDLEEKDEASTELENVLPAFEKDEVLNLDHLEPEQKFTLPPARFTEPSLVKAMEEDGIGRPSTYAPTISTILDRAYVDKEERYLIPTELGRKVTTLLREYFDPIINETFTAKMEERLDSIEMGDISWKKALQDFYPDFHEMVLYAKSHAEKQVTEPVYIGEKCPDCGGDLMQKDGRNGVFIACSNFPECRYTRNLPENIPAHCPLCGSTLATRMSKRRKKFFVCAKEAKDPECPFISWDMPIDGKTCESCGAYMVLKRFRGKAYPRCSNAECITNAKKKKTDKKEDDKVDNLEDKKDEEKDA